MIIGKRLKKCLFATDWFVLQIFIEWLCLHPFSCYHYPNGISEFVSHTLCSCLDIFSTTNNIWKIWYSKFQQVSTRAFHSWDDTYTHEWNCHSPYNVSKCTETTSTFSTITSTEWNLCLSWSNHIVTCFRLQLIVGGFFKHQNKKSNTDRQKGDLSPLVPVKSTWTLWKEISGRGLNRRLLNVW